MRMEGLMDGGPSEHGKEQKVPNREKPKCNIFKLDCLYWCKVGKKIISKGIPERPEAEEEVVHLGHNPFGVSVINSYN